MNAIDLIIWKRGNAMEHLVTWRAAPPSPKKTANVNYWQGQCDALHSLQTDLRNQEPKPITPQIEGVKP